MKGSAVARQNHSFRNNITDIFSYLGYIMRTKNYLLDAWPYFLGYKKTLRYVLSTESDHSPPFPNKYAKGG